MSPTRPVLSDAGIEVETAALNQQAHADRDRALGSREHDWDGILVQLAKNPGRTSKTANRLRATLTPAGTRSPTTGQTLPSSKIENHDRECAKNHAVKASKSHSALLAAAEHTGAVLTSTATLYGYGPVTGPMTETTPLAAH